MNRSEILENVKKLSVQLKRPILVEKYKRTKIIQEEIVDAYKTPVPNGIKVNGKNRQVEKDNWIVIHNDGTQSSYTEGEFLKIFEPISLGETFKGGQNEPAPNE